MFLITLDENNIVTARLALNDITSLPLNTRLDANHMLVGIPVNLGQVFDDVTGSFSTPARKRWLTKLAFDSRFTMAEASALKLAQELPTKLEGETEEAFNGRRTNAAMLQVMQSRMAMATYIDLTRTDTRSSVQLLETMGLLAPGRALEILDGAIAPHEYFPDA